MRPALPILCLISAALAGCHADLLNPAGPIASAERTILLDSVAIMLLIVIPTMAATLVFAWRFRQSNTRADYWPEWQYSGRIELIVWSIPVLVILFLGGITWLSSHQLDPAQPIRSSRQPLEIQAVSLDWKWLFIYPQQRVAAVNQLVVPQGTPLHLNVTSASVFNVFFVPRLGSEIYAMHGMVTELNLRADETGSFPGLSANFSGDGFADMAFEARSVAPDRFDAWISSARGGRHSLDEAEYGRLLNQSRVAEPYTYGTVRDGLFSDIAMDRLGLGRGPQTGRGGPPATPR